MKTLADESINAETVWDQPTQYHDPSPHLRGGLTKREYFASMIMQGMAHSGINECGNEQWYAKRSVEMADALIKKLNE